MTALARALLDAGDRLVEADARVLALNRAAGGSDRLVLPGVLTVAQLARGLGVAIAKRVLVAGDPQCWMVWLRAEPDGLGVRLTFADWTPHDARTRRLPALEQPDTPALLAPGFAEPLRGALDPPITRIVDVADRWRANGGASLPEPYRDYAQGIWDAGRHLQALVGDVVALDRAEPPATVARERVDLAASARRAAGLLQLVADEHDVRLVVIEAQAWGLGDDRRVLQIATNLLSNAITHSPSGGEVTLAAHEADGTATLTVTDEGPGVAAGDRDWIFDRHVRLTPERGTGSGLGLHISRRLARAMRGDLVVDGEPGRGARFTLSLPAARSSLPVV